MKNSPPQTFHLLQSWLDPVNETQKTLTNISYKSDMNNIRNG